MADYLAQSDDLKVKLQETRVPKPELMQDGALLHHVTYKNRPYAEATYKRSTGRVQLVHLLLSALVGLLIGLLLQFTSDFLLLNILCSESTVRFYEHVSLDEVDSKSPSNLRSFYLCHMKTVLDSIVEVNKSVKLLHEITEYYPKQVDSLCRSSEEQMSAQRQLLCQLYVLMWIVARGDVAGRTAILLALMITCGLLVSGPKRRSLVTIDDAPPNFGI